MSLIIGFILGILTIVGLVMAYCMGYKHGYDEATKLNINKYDPTK